MQMNEATRLECYKNSLRTAWGYNDYNDWPIKFNSIMHLFLTEFTGEFLDDLEAIKARKIPAAEVGTAFGNPARLYRLINPLIFGMKRRKMEIAKQRQIVIYLLDIVKAMKYGSEFNEDKHNMIFSPDQVKALYLQLPFRKAVNMDAISLQRFCGMMWAYTEAIFFRAHDVTKEVHGPYFPGNGQDFLLVREYLNLTPDDIWIKFPFIPFKTINVYTCYNNTLDVCIDSYNHLSLNSGNYVHDLTNFCIIADGQNVSIEELLKIVPVLQSTIRNIHEWVSNAEPRDLINRYADIFWYRKSPLCKLTGRDWKVPESVRENIRNGQAEQRRMEVLSEEAIDRLINFII